MTETGVIALLAAGRDPLARLLLEDSASGVLVLDSFLRIQAANATARAILGPGRETNPGRPITPLFADGDAVATALAGILAGAPAARLDLHLAPIADEPEHAVAILPAPAREADGRISGLILRILDRAAERQLQDRLIRGQTLQAVGQLAGGIAHDFNNLLAAIAAATELIEARPETTDPIRDDTAVIAAATARGAALVRQLLAFGRRQDLRPAVLRVNPAITALAALLTRLLPPTSHLRLDLSAEELCARVDPTQFDQVILNLAMNASQALQGAGRAGEIVFHSGHVTLYRALDRGAESIPPGQYTMVEVRDDGPGIPPAQRARIFDPFFTTRREAGGTGLGLATVHGIVRQSGGFISVDSGNSGTRFRVYLPRAEAPAEPATAATPPPPLAAPPQPSGLVILADDEAGVREVTARALRLDGWQVSAHDSAESALAELQAMALTPPAALVSDILMPGMDGPSLARAARALHPNLPVLLISGYTENPLPSPEGTEEFPILAKPYSLATLRGQLRALVQAATPPAA